MEELSPVLVELLLAQHHGLKRTARPEPEKLWGECRSPLVPDVGHLEFRVPELVTR